MPTKFNKDNWKALPAKNVSVPEEIEKDNELWILEVPVGFDISTLDGKKVTFADGQVIDKPDGAFSKQLLVEDYRSLKSKAERFIFPDNEKWCYANPAGKVSVIDYLDQVETEQVPSAVIARCPKLPTGLKQHYRPFGVIDTSRNKKSGRVQKPEVSTPSKHSKRARNSKS